MAASAALVAFGALAVAQFASDDDSPVANAAQQDGTTPPTPAPETAPPAPDTAPPATEPADPESPADGELDGQIVIQIGDGEPIVIDLGELGALGEGGLGDLGGIEECVGDLPFDINLDLGELDLGDLGAAPGDLGLPSFDIFGDGGTMTITGPNGLSVLTWGEGDGSVTITKQDGEITISSDGDVQVDDLSASNVSLPPSPSLPGMPNLPDFDHIFECLQENSGADNG